MPDGAVTLAGLQAVIFDNDGTFLDTESAWSRAETELFRRRGLEFADEHRKQLIGSSFADASQHLERFLGEPGNGSQIMEELSVIVHDELEHGVDLMPFAGEIVTALKQAGLPVVMATNANTSFAMKALTQAGEHETFATVITSDHVTSPKPAPDIYLAAAEFVGADPRFCVGIEDSRTGVLSAKSAGMTVVGISSHPEVRLDEAHHEFDSLGDRLLWELLGIA